MSKGGADKPTARGTLSAEYQRDWPAYFDAVRGQPARETLTRALGAFAREGRCGGVMLDIAAGEGRDTRAALREPGPWRVIATDTSAEGLARLHASLATGDAARVRTLEISMEDLPARLDALAGDLAGVPVRADLVNASFALPFCRPECFDTLWTMIRDRLAPGGRFAGQFFGERDEWAPIRPASHHTRARVLELLDGLSIEHLEEVDREGSDAMGGVKHHHVFHVVARRDGAPSMRG